MPSIAVGLDHSFQIVAIHDDDSREHELDTSARVLHDLLHPDLNLMARGFVGLTETGGVQFVVTRIGPTLPVPNPDLVGDVPLNHLAGIRQIATITVAVEFGYGWSEFDYYMGNVG